MLLRTVSWLLGYVVLEIVGENTEQFMNLCLSSGKDVWGVSITSNGIQISVRLSEVKGIRAIARKARVKIVICRKKGIRFSLCRLKKRWGLILGAVLFCLILWFLSGRIWMIQIQGNETMKTAAIQEMLSQYGVSQGVCAGEFDWPTLRQTILSKNPQISWMSFNPNGSVLSVDISETTTPPEMVQDDSPCNLTAVRDGRIVEMQVYTGTPMVQVGDAVVRGDVLISGAVEYSDGYTLLRRASGRVMAETVHEYEVFVPFQYTREIPTGEVVSRKVITCFGLNLPLYFGSVDFPYIKETDQQYLTIKGVILPVGIKKATFTKTKVTTATRTVVQAKEKGRELAEEYKNKMFTPEQIKDMEITFQETARGVSVKCRFFCIENIIFCEKLLIF